MNLNDRVSKLERRDTTKMIADIAITILMVIVIVYLIVMGVRSFYPEKEKVITFNITGIINSTNATTLTQLHLECIKFCGKDLVYSSNDKVDKCWKECEKLGKEQPIENKEIDLNSFSRTSCPPTWIGECFETKAYMLYINTTYFDRVEYKLMRKSYFIED